MRRIGKNPVSQLRNKCDKALQQLGRQRYSKCEVCGNPISCLHHFYPKSTSSRLRYDWDNLIPICNGCHMQHHQAGNPKIHGTVIEKRGLEWYQELTQTKEEIQKVGVGYYREILEELESELNG